MALPIIITFTIMFVLLFFLVGGIMGWILKQYVSEKVYVNLHPEMYDSHGNLIPDEILAVRFETDYDNYDDEEDTDEDK